MTKENKSRYAVLGMLSMAPMSGYDLKKTIELSTSNFWKESYGQIYPMLKQLAKDGLTSSHIEQQEGRPARHVYALTDKGWDELRRWLTEAVEYQVERNELLLKLFFGGQITTSISIEHLQKFRALHTGLLQRYIETEASIKTQFAESRHLPYWLITLNSGKHVSQALITWCDETLDTLSNLAKTEPVEATIH